MRTITSAREARSVPYPRPTARTRAGRWATAGRLALGVYFLLMAPGVNVCHHPCRTRTPPTNGLARLSWPHFAWVPDLISGPIAVPFTIVLVRVGDRSSACSCSASGRAVRVARWAALFQVLALAPFLGWYKVANLATAVLIAALLTRTHDRTIIDLAIGRREHHGS